MNGSLVFRPKFAPCPTTPPSWSHELIFAARPALVTLLVLHIQEKCASLRSAVQSSKITDFQPHSPSPMNSDMCESLVFTVARFPIGSIFLLFIRIIPYFFQTRHSSRSRRKVQGPAQHTGQVLHHVQNVGLQCISMELEQLFSSLYYRIFRVSLSVNNSFRQFYS